jgi:glycosyltransferase involved in cell wall biosynthesis
LTRTPSIDSSALASRLSGQVRRLSGENLFDPGNRTERSTNGQAPISSAASSVATAAVPEHNREVLLWQWGHAFGKFTYELARELRNVPGIKATVSAARGSELASLAGSDANIAVRLVRTFEGEKLSAAGKLAAAVGLLGLPRLARDFRRSLAEGPAEVAICTFQSIWDVAAIPILRRHTSRFILILHDAKFHLGDHYPFRESVLGWEIETADALIVLSDHVGRVARDFHGFPPDRIWIVPHGALSFGAGVAAPRAFPSNRPVRLLFFGRIVAYKGLGHLFDAYRILRERGVALELDIVGSGDFAPYRSHLAGLSDVTITNAWVDEEKIAEALARADVVVLPYIEASQSGVAAAALTAALPIVATPVGGLVEQVSCGRTGIIAKGMQAEDLAAAIQRFTRDPSLYETCSAGALQHAREELGWARIATRIADIVHEVASRPRRRDQKSPATQLPAVAPLDPGD